MYAATSGTTGLDGYRYNKWNAELQKQPKYISSNACVVSSERAVSSKDASSPAVEASAVPKFLNPSGMCIRRPNPGSCWAHARHLVQTAPNPAVGAPPEYNNALTPAITCLPHAVPSKGKGPVMVVSVYNLKPGCNVDMFLKNRTEATLKVFKAHPGEMRGCHGLGLQHLAAAHVLLGDAF